MQSILIHFVTVFVVEWGFGQMKALAGGGRRGRGLKTPLLFGDLWMKIVTGLCLVRIAHAFSAPCMRPLIRHVKLLD